MQNKNIPGLSWPKPFRILWLITVTAIVIAGTLNLSLVLADSSPIPPLPPSSVSTAPETSSSSGQQLKDGEELCELSVVLCPGEPEMAVSRMIATTPPETSAPVKIGASKEMQAMVDYAWELSHSMDFILTIERESGFNPKAINVNRNGTIDSGLAQINHFWHPKIVKDPRFKDWKWQLEQGWSLYKKGTVFYGYFKRNEVRDRFAMK